MSMRTMMRALRAARPGGPEELNLEEIEAPEPGPGEIRIQIRACGLNFADLLMLKGTYQSRPAFPLIPGLEAAGVVEALGPGATRFCIGDRVAVCCGSGGFAEMVCAPESACVAIPPGVSDEAAAGLMVAYGTADLGLRDRARLRPGETLLVTGAAGGVGLTAVEVGKLMGARVIALARGEEKLALAREKGADEAIDSETPELAAALKALTGGRGVDVIYDAVGGALFKEIFRAIAFDGRILPIGFASGEAPLIPANHLLVKNASVIGLWWGAWFERRPEAMAESLERVFSWAYKEKIAPHVSHVFSLAEGREALETLAARKAAGKISLKIS